MRERGEESECSCNITAEREREQQGQSRKAQGRMNHVVVGGGMERDMLRSGESFLKSFALCKCYFALVLGYNIRDNV